MQDFTVIRDGKQMWTVRTPAGSPLGYILACVDGTWRSCGQNGGLVRHSAFTDALMALVQ